MNDMSQGQRRELTAEQQWEQFTVLKTADDYIDSLRGRNLDVYLLGERIEEPVDHPIVRPSINAMAESYILADEDPDLATAWSSISEQQINRFLHVPESAEDLVQKNKMQRRMGQLTGTCFQRCAGLDTLSVLFSITYDIDKKHGTPYHQRYVNFLKKAQTNNLIVGAGMTDPKGDRSKRPSDQADPDLFMHVTRRTDAGTHTAPMLGGASSRSKITRSPGGGTCQSIVCAIFDNDGCVGTEKLASPVCAARSTAIALAGAVVSKPTAKKTTSRSGCSSARRTASRGL